MTQYTEAIGRRKEASARVRLYPGTGDIVVNDRPVNDYFGRDLDQMILRQPLVLTGTEATYNISIHVAGGGDSGQAGAVRLGIARALCDVGLHVQQTAFSRPCVGQRINDQKFNAVLLRQINGL